MSQYQQIIIYKSEYNTINKYKNLEIDIGKNVAP